MVHSVSCRSSNMVACVVTALKLSMTVAVQITPAVSGLALETHYSTVHLLIFVQISGLNPPLHDLLQ